MRIRPLLNDIGLPFLSVGVDIGFRDFVLVICVGEENFQALLCAAGGRQTSCHSNLVLFLVE